MTHAEAVKAPCPYRIRQIVSEPVPGGRTCAKYDYECCLGNQCPRWRLRAVTECGPSCAGTGSFEGCLAAHGVTDCDTCPDRHGHCGR